MEDLPDDEITEPSPVSDVDLFDPVDLKETQGHRLVGTSLPGGHTFDPLSDGRPRGEPREWIVELVGGELRCSSQVRFEEGAQPVPPQGHRHTGVGPHAVGLVHAVDVVTEQEERDH